MSFLRIRLLGDFLTLADDEPVTGLHQARLQSLLAYLLVHRHAPQSRQHLAFLFWPDSAETQARANLRKALYHMRRTLPDADRFLQTDTQTMQWVPDAPYTLDVADFERKLANADAAQQRTETDAAVTHLTKAVALYRGELLPGCYEDWVLAERERLHQLALDALERLMQLAEDAQAYDAAIGHGRRLLALDPVHEATYRRLMRLHALHGDRAGALRVYHTCADVLQRELNVEPSADTQELYARLLQSETAQPPQMQPHQTADITRLVGRAAEWRQLQAAWRMATEMRPHVALVAGEAGIGKSHLAQEIQQWAAQQGITTAHARAYAAEGGLAYAPVVDWLRSEPFRTELARLEPVWRSEVARLLPELLEDDADLPRPQPLTERWQRQRLFEALTRAVLLAPMPLLLVLDDLQWCDGETLEWLHFLLRAAPDLASDQPTAARVLVVGTVRPAEVDEQHPLTRLLLDLRRAGQVTEMALEPLTADETATLANQVADRALNSEITDFLYRASAGNPLFLVEMVRAEQWRRETADQRLETRDVQTLTAPQAPSSSPQSPVSDAALLPPKVYAVIQSRLAQLSPQARELTSLAAAIGRSFTFDLLAQASDADEDILVRGLDELWQRRIVREVDAGAYDFSHDRIRDVAYAEISPVQRRFYHQRLVQALTALHADEISAVSGQLGFHCERARRPKDAITYYRQATGASVELYAFESALFYLRKVLKLLEELPTSAERTQLQIESWLTIADYLIITAGWTAVERKDTLEQAAELSKAANNDPLLYKATAGLRGYYANSGDQYTAYRLARDMLLLAEKIQDQKLLCHAYCSTASSHLQRGEFQSSLTYYRKAQDMLDDIEPDYWPVDTRCRMVEVLWACGYSEQAQEIAVESIRIIDQQANPFGRVHTREFIMHMYQRAGDPVAAKQLAAEISDLCERFGFPNYALSAQTIAGWAAAQLGAAEEGVRQITQALHTLEQIGDRVNRPYFMAVLAEAQAQSGRVANALKTIARAKEMVEKFGDRLWEAELHRLTGDFRLRLDPADAEAETCYQSALHVARRQGARSLELRAAISLARLWQQQGRQAEAHDLLAPIYGWFTEGFDTPDLHAARTLLETLSAST